MIEEKFTLISDDTQPLLKLTGRDAIPAHTMSFHVDGKEVGTYNMDTGEFTGNIQDSAKAFFDAVTQLFTSEVADLRKRNDELADFAIWMTGCGYDFTQHDHFCKQRDKLLKELDSD